MTWKNKNSQIDLGVQLKSVHFSNVKDIIGKDSDYENEFAKELLLEIF